MFSSYNAVLMAHKQNFVWLSRHENKEMQFVIAAVAAAMMALSNEMITTGTEKN
jgi:hypothetical protein